MARKSTSRRIVGWAPRVGPKLVRLSFVAPWVPVTSTGMTPEGLGLRRWEAAIFVLRRGREDGLKVCWNFQHTQTSSRHVLPGPISQRAQGLPVILAPGSEEDRSIQYRFSLNSVVSGRKLQAIGVVGFIGQTHWFEYGDEWVPATSTGMTPEGLACGGGRPPCSRCASNGQAV